MNDRTFTKLIIAVLAICVIATAAHLAYAIYAYQHCSIICFIGKELW